MANTPAVTTDSDLAKIREILFGSRARELEATLDKMEADVMKRVDEVRARVERSRLELDSRIERLNKDMEAQLDEVRNSLAKSMKSLQKSGMERARLSSLLSELATRIDDDEDEERADG